jgi:hypothetical protein
VLPSRCETGQVHRSGNGVWHERARVALESSLASHARTARWNGVAITAVHNERAGSKQLALALTMSVTVDMRRFEMKALFAAGAQHI